MKPQAGNAGAPLSPSARQPLTPSAPHPLGPSSPQPLSSPAREEEEGLRAAVRCGRARGVTAEPRPVRGPRHRRARDTSCTGRSRCPGRCGLWPVTAGCGARAAGRWDPAAPHGPGVPVLRTGTLRPARERAARGPRGAGRRLAGCTGAAPRGAGNSPAATSSRRSAQLGSRRPAQQPLRGGAPAMRTRAPPRRRWAEPGGHAPGCSRRRRISAPWRLRGLLTAQLAPALRARGAPLPPGSCPGTEPPRLGQGPHVRAAGAWSGGAARALPTPRPPWTSLSSLQNEVGALFVGQEPHPGVGVGHAGLGTLRRPPEPGSPASLDGSRRSRR